MLNILLFYHRSSHKEMIYLQSCYFIVYLVIEEQRYYEILLAVSISFFYHVWQESRITALSSATVFDGMLRCLGCQMDSPKTLLSIL